MPHANYPNSIGISLTRYPLMFPPIRLTMLVHHFEKSNEYDSLGPYERSSAYSPVSGIDKPSPFLERELTFPYQQPA